MDLTTLKELVAIDSPSGYTKEAAKYIFNTLKSFGWKPEYTNKGAVKCNLGEKPSVCFAAHMDTLGAVVSEIKGNGNMRILPVGGPSKSGTEGAYCRIITHSNTIYTGTILFDNPATHVNHKLDTTLRTWDNLHIRLDEEVASKTEVEDLGIEVGDFVFFETNYVELPSGYVKSRFMDNKAGCFVLFEMAKKMAEMKKTAPVELFFSNYEEVGHGGSTGYDSNIEELIVIDMGVVGDGRTGLETHCSICAKDSTGPYDYEIRKKLVDLSKANNIPYKVDVYPFYGSDGSAALRAGNNFRVGLIGMGVSASHGVERTHVKGIKATVDLCMAYMGF